MTTVELLTSGTISSEKGVVAGFADLSGRCDYANTNGLERGRGVDVEDVFQDLEAGLVVVLDQRYPA